MNLASSRRLARLAPLAAALALPAAAQAQQSPYYIGAAQAFSHDSNLFRARSGSVNEVSDSWSTTSLLAGLDQPIGRQRLKANAAVRANKYQDQDQLDNTAYELGAGLDWETIGRLSGTVNFAATQSLARFAQENAPLITDRKNIQRANTFDATAQWGGPSILALYGLYGHREVTYSLSAYDPFEYQRDQLGAGVRWRVGGALTLGAEVRGAKGEYPHFLTTGADKFDRQDVALTALWVPTGASRLSARLGASKEDHDVASRDFSGATGSILWSWQPTGKLQLDTEFVRDTGNEAEAINPQLLTIFPNAVGDNSRVLSRLQLRARYQATAKVQFDATARYTRRSLVQQISLGGGQPTIADAGHDTTTSLQIGARWQPTRTIEVGCAVGREQRNADVAAGSTISYDYGANTASCFAQLLLRP